MGETAAAVPAGDDNLVLRAAQALQARTGHAGGATMTLIKRIPARAGLGGGSADCAAALTGMNRLWELGLSGEALMELGASLGADVPFCLTGGLARVRGVGEIIQPLPFAPGVPLVLIRPGDGLSTPKVYRLWDEDFLADGPGREGERPARSQAASDVPPTDDRDKNRYRAFPGIASDIPALIEALARSDLAAVAALNGNALTAPAIKALPDIGKTLSALRESGAAAAFMTGSGSAVVGAFESEEAARRAAERLDGAIFAWTLGRKACDDRRA